jgi:hypothetical protein
VFAAKTIRAPSSTHRSVQPTKPFDARGADSVEHEADRAISDPKSVVFGVDPKIDVGGEPNAARFETGGVKTTAGAAPTVDNALQRKYRDRRTPSDGRFNFAMVPVTAPVQKRNTSDGSGSFQSQLAGGVHSAADLATSGPGQPLPHRAEIQRSFGRHELSDVKAHTDAAARAGVREMQAVAFTRGRHVAFADSPSLHVAAHEAAHVIQQRAGLQLRGGLGQRGDLHEQHAEAVAQRVVHRQSTESLLNAYANRAGALNRNVNVQRFESEEHQHLGDAATGSRTYDLADAATHPGDRFELTHGDIQALSGDVFAPDELFRLAAIPGNRGTLKGTRDEVIYALSDPTIWEMRSGKTGPGPYTGKNDPRFAKGGIWDFTFSPDVQAAVVERYQKLAAANASHFVAPLGRDKKGNPIATPDSAGANYRDLHEFAIREAYKAGAVGGSINTAMAREAAAQHFLADSFSAGHLRTPIASIRTYWSGRYPLFWYNLRHKIALDTAIAMTQGTVVPNYTGYTRILANVEAMAPTLPAITLGDLLAKVFHDVDNEQGVAIKGGGKVFGDAHLDAGTEKLAVAAIVAGNKDIEEAFNLGVQNKLPMRDADTYAKVRARNGGTKDKYAPELQVPAPDKSEPPQNWKAPDIATLWDQHLLGKTGDTVGTAISNTVRTGAIAGQLTDLAARFPVDAPLGMHPRAAYLTGFVGQMQSDPKAGVIDIVSWAPHDMATGSAPREMVQDLVTKGAAGDKKENLGNMKMDQRAKMVNALISDGGPGLVHPNGIPEDLEQIFTIFRGLNHAGRLQLFRAVEGRDWTGDFSRTWPFRDELFKAMEKTGNNLTRLRTLLNAK